MVDDAAVRRARGAPGKALDGIILDPWFGRGRPAIWRLEEGLPPDADCRAARRGQPVPGSDRLRGDVRAGDRELQAR
jgi:hypothetical protein